MIVRPLLKSDDAQLSILIATIENSLSDYTFWLPISDASRNHFFDSEWTHFFGAFDGGKLIAAVGLFLNENEYGESRKTVHLENKRVAEIGRAMCAPDFRRKGILNELTEEAIRQAKELDLEVLIATAHPKNVPSQSLLCHFGFAKEGYVIKSKFYERDIFVKWL